MSESSSSSAAGDAWRTATDASARRRNCRSGCTRSGNMCTVEAIPILRVNDVETSLAWYARLGYEKEWEHRFEPSFPAFVSIAGHGSSRLFLSEHSEDAGGPLLAGTVVYLRVDDVDAIAKQFDSVIVEMPWAREVCLSDPDGNRLRIGTPST